MTDPTPRQAEILLAIYHHQLEHGAPPTLRQLFAPTGIRSNNGVASLLEPLQRKGYLTILPQRACGIRLAGVHWYAVFDDTDAGKYLEALVIASSQNVQHPTLNVRR